MVDGAHFLPPTHMIQPPVLSLPLLTSFDPNKIFAQSIACCLAMCSLAPRVATLSMGVATAFLDSCGGVAVVSPVTHSIGVDLPTCPITEA